MMDYPIIATALGLVAVPMWFMGLTAYERFRTVAIPQSEACPRRPRSAVVDGDLSEATTE